jgi:hypothetical protein
MQDAIGTDAKKINAIPVNNETLPACCIPSLVARNREDAGIRATDQASRKTDEGQSAVGPAAAYCEL